MTDPSERRTEIRLNEDTTIFVEVCSGTLDNDEPPQILICNGVDISANGILVLMDERVPLGTILRLCVELEDTEQALYLVGEVKWVGEQPGGGFNIGFELYDAENTDIIGWKGAIAGLLTSDKD